MLLTRRPDALLHVFRSSIVREVVRLFGGGRRIRTLGPQPTMSSVHPGARAATGRRYRDARNADRSRLRAICGMPGALFTWTKSAWRSKSASATSSTMRDTQLPAKIAPTERLPTAAEADRASGVPRQHPARSSAPSEPASK
jgi:hypothetical protein